MNLRQLYSLRSEFVILGLTGRVGSGCSKIAQILSSNEILDLYKDPIQTNVTEMEEIKRNICYKFLNTTGNWKNFMVINYKDVLLLHLLFECSSKSDILCIKDILVQNDVGFQNRFTQKDTSFLEEKLTAFLEQQVSKTLFDRIKTELKELSLVESLKKSQDAYNLLYDGMLSKFSYEFYELLNTESIIKRSRFTHDIAGNLRATGTVYTPTQKTNNLNSIYTIAETINQLIKIWRRENGYARFVIDSLKNSLEITYFKEKYSAFYMISSNRTRADRTQYLEETLAQKGLINPILKSTVSELIKLDDIEHKTGHFKMGIFSSPDLGNCIQKSDYHIFIKNDADYSIPLKRQLVKLMALITQPGIITPSIHEHFMQVAYNAKFNSGCISRQVGAVVTDEAQSIKAIGWNDVPEGHTPCSLRSLDDFVSKKADDMFSEYEQTGGDYKGKTFREKSEEVLQKADLIDLNGRNCSFCFKSFHNEFEKTNNQVHTRSLHAEENAMLQITKYGGQGIRNGYLYTTASPCELCSKKAYQLGIKTIYYIDPYPGIAISHILKGGPVDKNPTLILFEGAVGRAFHKLYEPFMAYKDEVSILTGLNPTQL